MFAFQKVKVRIILHFATFAKFANLAKARI